MYFAFIFRKSRKPYLKIHQFKNLIIMNLLLAFENFYQGRSPFQAQTGGRTLSQDSEYFFLKKL